MGACFARVQRIANQEKRIRARDEHIQEVHKIMVQLEEVNETRLRDLVRVEADIDKVKEENILLKQLMSDVSN